VRTFLLVSTPSPQMESRLAAALASAAEREAMAVKQKDTALELAVRERAAAEQALKQQLVRRGCAPGPTMRPSRLISPRPPFCRQWLRKLLAGYKRRRTKRPR
jgi:hypothetical protein